MHQLPMGTVTLLFTDMEGSTHLLQQLGERYTNLLEEYRQLLRAAFQQWNGHEVDTQGDALSLYALAQIVAAQGDDARSQSLYEEGIAVARKAGNRETLTFGLEGLAGVVAVQGELVWAARLWGAAEALPATIGSPIAPVERPAYESSVTAARAQLGEKPFATVWAEGRLMTPE
jgi:class 3 adenylate cyclase